MADLRKTTDLSRALMWNNKSIANCSKKELIDCIVYVTRRLAWYEARHNPKAILNPEIPVMPVPPEAEQSYNKDDKNP